MMWQSVIEAMIEAGIDTFVEVGPRRVLTGLLRRIDRSVRGLNVADPESAEKVATELGALA